ncbi:uncharacterized protein N7487_004217, partial [Penicillium crustosum]|uniref:uncharacterized protein n=1 Tax=Penicillium crustosum TaxID=36656 RepID=UPI002398C18E
RLRGIRLSACAFFFFGYYFFRFFSYRAPNLYLHSHSGIDRIPIHTLRDRDDLSAFNVARV